MSAAGSDLDLPPFRMRWPWLGPDLQTVRNHLKGRHAPLDHGPAQRLEIALDGPAGTDRLTVVWHQPVKDSGRPLVILVHGLTGCEDSFHIRNSAAHFLSRGWPVLRVNLRGAGPGAACASAMYNAGLSDDFRALLRGLPTAATGNGVVAMGVSLGANMLLKYAGEEGNAAGLRGLVSVSAPVDLQAAQRRIEARRNGWYHRKLLRDMLHGIRRFDGMRHLAEAQPIRRIYEFDDRVVAGWYGYDGADHYYAENSAARFVGGIRILTLMLHARDDPWIPAASYEALPAVEAVELRLSSGGGHVGFHGAGSTVAWHDRCAEIFFSRLISAAAS